MYYTGLLIRSPRGTWGSIPGYFWPTPFIQSCHWQKLLHNICTCIQLRDCSENIMVGWKLFDFQWRNQDTPSKDWQNLGAPLWGLSEYGYPPYIIFFLNTPISVLWSYLSYFSFLIKLVFGKIWVPPTPDKWRNQGTPPKASTPSNVFLLPFYSKKVLIQNTPVWIFVVVS